MDTFVIRIWMPAEELDSGPRAPLKGIIEHVSNGSLMVFEGGEELLRFISQNVKVSAQS